MAGVLDQVIVIKIAVDRNFEPVFAQRHTKRNRSDLLADHVWAVAVASAVAPAFAGDALTVPSTAPRSRRLGRRRSCLHDFEVALLVEDRPRNASQLIDERHRQYVMMQSFLGGFDPGFEPVALPALRPDQHHPGRLHEQDAQVAIAALRYLAEDGRPRLLWTNNQTSPNLIAMSPIKKPTKAAFTRS